MKRIGILMLALLAASVICIAAGDEAGKLRKSVDKKRVTSLIKQLGGVSAKERCGRA